MHIRAPTPPLPREESSLQLPSRYPAMFRINKPKQNTTETKIKYIIGGMETREIIIFKLRIQSGSDELFNVWNH